MSTDEEAKAIAAAMGRDEPARCDILWAEAKRLRVMLEQTLNREQRRELQQLLQAWRNAHLADALHVGGARFEQIAARLLEEP